MKIEDSFTVGAPIEKTWALLNDVPAVIPCMPGAELVEVRGDDEWLAQLATKVGPIAMKFDTEVTRTRSDDEAHAVDLAAKAKELKGRGRANAKISSSLVADGAGTKVSIVTDLQMQGPLAQFGRGVVGEISAQMTREFANCLAQRLDSPAAASTGEGGDQPAGAGPAPQAKPINGLRLFFSALGRWFIGLFKRGGRG
ncbi:MAG TPA: SRPBCC family protein [Solirubrobacterales bacterium]|jgi:hypothetical protein